MLRNPIYKKHLIYLKIHFHAYTFSFKSITQNSFFSILNLGIPHNANRPTAIYHLNQKFPISFNFSNLHLVIFIQTCNGTDAFHLHIITLLNLMIVLLPLCTLFNIFLCLPTFTKYLNTCIFNLWIIHKFFNS